MHLAWGSGPIYNKPKMAYSCDAFPRNYIERDKRERLERKTRKRETNMIQEMELWLKAYYRLMR